MLWWRYLIIGLRFPPLVCVLCKPQYSFSEFSMAIEDTVLISLFTLSLWIERLKTGGMDQILRKNKGKYGWWIASPVYCQTLFFFFLRILIPSLLIKTTLQEKLWLKEAQGFSLGASDKESKRENEKIQGGIHEAIPKIIISSCSRTGLLET